MTDKVFDYEKNIASFSFVFDRVNSKHVSLFVLLWLPRMFQSFACRYAGLSRRCSVGVDGGVYSFISISII